MLNEILENYYEDQDGEIIQDFKLSLWGSKYVFKKYKKKYTYEVNEEKLNNNKDLIELFKKYETVEVKYCKSFYKSNLDSIDYIRIHINNMYGYLVDDEVYLPREYYKLLNVPRNEYYKAIAYIEKGGVVNLEDIKSRIEDSFNKAEETKKERIDKKINLTFNEYMEIINIYIDRLFDNYIPPFEYEIKHGWELRNGVAGWSEDNYAVKYFCTSLTGYMKNYIKSLQPKEEKFKGCKSCGESFKYKSSKKLYCDKCRSKKQLEWQRLSMERARKKM